MRQRDFLKIVVDLDGTILEERPTPEKPRAVPLPGAVIALNNLYEMGHIIIIHSARANCDLELTLKQLDEYGIKYHHVVLGKPAGDIFIDDRAFTFTDWEKDWIKLLKLIAQKLKQPYEEKSN